jgi:glycosyltransferase involved in cell wall biosynthesis
VPRHITPLRAAVRAADVVHVLGFRDPVGTLASASARRHGIPYLLEPEGMLPARGRSRALKQAFDATLGRNVLNGAASIIATSSLEASQIAPGRALPKIEVRPNGVAPRRPAAPGLFRRRLGIGDDVRLALTIGRIATVKRFDLVVDALARIPDMHGAIVGTDEGDGALASIERTIARHSLHERVTVITTGLWDEDKDAALRDADVFVLASEAESFGLAAAEAACAGAPVVVTEGCGVSEWLPRQTCRVVPVDDINGLAIAMGATTDGRDATARDQRAAAAIAAVGWDAIVPRQIALYEAVTA